LLTQQVGGQNTLRPPTSKSGGTCPPVHPMIDAHGRVSRCCHLLALHVRRFFMCAVVITLWVLRTFDFVQRLNGGRKAYIFAWLAKLLGLKI